MARRYVRDKIGRFAAKGGGGKRSGKMSKSTAGRSAKAKYKAAASGLRKKTSGIGVNTTKGSKAHKKQVTAAKSKLTRTRNKLTGKGKAAGSGIKKGLSAQAASRRKQTFKGKTTKGRSAKAEWKAARRADRKGPLGEGRALDRNQKRVIKKQTGKTAYSQGFRETPAKTKAPRLGSKTKSQRRREKIESKKSLNQTLRGNKFKGPKKRVTKKAAAAAIKKRDAARYAEFSKKYKAERKGGLKPKKGETAKGFKARLKRSSKNPNTQRALRDPDGRGSYYSNPAQDIARRKRRTTAKSKRRAESRDTWGDGTGGNKRSRAITKSKQRHRAKVKKRELAAKKKKRSRR